MDAGMLPDRESKLKQLPPQPSGAALRARRVRLLSGAILYPRSSILVFSDCGRPAATTEA